MGFGDEKRYYLSVVDPLDDSVSETINLPFETNEVVYGGSCVGWLYFHDLMGKIVLFNLTSKELQVLPPPDYPEPETFSLSGCGLGYDPKSEDYKLIRIYAHEYYRNENSLEEPSLYYTKMITDVYSFKSASWKTITTPDPELHTSNGIYVGETGCCYWIADLFEGGDVYGLVLSFDFATESFDCLDLPLSTSTFPVPVYFNRLVECGGLLGAIGRTPSQESYMELYVWKGQMWNRLYNVSLARVDRVLGVTQDGQLLVHDLLKSRRWKKLSVFDYKQIMDGLCLFVDLLPLGSASKQKTRSKNRRPLRMKTRRGERMRTVSKKKTTVAKKKLNHIPADVVDEIQPPAMSLKRCRALATGKCTFTVV